MNDGKWEIVGELLWRIERWSGNLRREEWIAKEDRRNVNV